ncbi:metal-dependent transcriptional regulator [Candidatus Bipolaricaulota bacterium]|nr:metal-dependent transcriptional regulator [Candidatus Bipolaricaulota bacterium]
MITKNLEDYLEAIYNSIRTRGHAGTNEIARDLQVKPPSVTEMFRKLNERGWVNYKKYEGVTLTREGKRIAKNVSDVHSKVRKFLELIQVSSEQADEDACQVEHHLSQESIGQLSKFIEFIENCPEEQARWIEHFHYFSRHEELPAECRAAADKGLRD